MVASPATLAEEYDKKSTRIRAFLGSYGLHGILLWKRAAFAWITGGRDNRVVDGTETGFAGILTTPEGRWCLADAIEAPRMRQEELAGTGIEVVEFPWHDELAAARQVRALLADLGLDPGKVAADVARPALDFAPLPPEFERLRWQLTPAEVDRYREGGQRASAAVEAAAMAVHPGMSEQEISGLLDHHVRAAGLVTVVNLVATDERIFRYRHPIPTAKKLERYVMLVSCCGFGGLISNLTRFVHFGQPPADLGRRQQAVADVDAAANLATRPGREFGEIFADIQAAYASAGFADEWKLHHQGGSSGYAAREVVARPGDETRVLSNQAFAWNPSITGTKSEDTMLVTSAGVEMLTAPTDAWPIIVGSSRNRTLSRAAVLVR